MVLVVVKVLLVMHVTAAARGYRRGLGIGRYGGAATVADKAANVGQLLMVAVVVSVCQRGRETACHVE